MPVSPPFALHAALPQARRAPWHDPILVGPSMIGERALQTGIHRRVLSVMERLAPDDFVTYLLELYRAGLRRWEDGWRYCDLACVTLAAAEILQPLHCCEVGVRRGRSLAMVAQACPDARLYGFDLWDGEYAGMPNPGPDFVRRELARLGCRGELHLVHGDSHQTLPRFLLERPDLYFDLVIVDGDHTPAGARRDLVDLKPRVKLGGALIFDDLAHPATPGLASVWRQHIVRDPHFVTWEFTEVGYGVGIAIRRP